MVSQTTSRSVMLMQRLRDTLDELSDAGGLFVDPSEAGPLAIEALRLQNQVDGLVAQAIADAECACVAAQQGVRSAADAKPSVRSTISRCGAITLGTESGSSSASCI